MNQTKTCDAFCRKIPSSALSRKARIFGLCNDNLVRFGVFFTDLCRPAGCGPSVGCGCCEHCGPCEGCGTTKLKSLIVWDSLDTKALGYILKTFFLGI